MTPSTKRMRALLAAMIVAGLAGAPMTARSATTATTTAATSGESRVATRFASPFVALAGSQENAIALANALRTGTPATLTYTTIGADGAPVSTTVEIAPSTRPMGWGNVRHSLALAQYSLSQAGITHPTGDQLAAALVGGDVTTADGGTLAMPGVLEQRASGMGWGQIARSYGTTMGAVNRGPRSPVVAERPPTDAQPTTTRVSGTLPPTKTVTNAGGTSAAAPGAKGMTTAAGSASAATHGGNGLTTAGGSAAASGSGGKGLTTASGAAAHSQSGRVVGAQGASSGNAYGRGIVNASGGAATNVAATHLGASSGAVNGHGAAASATTSAQPGNGGAHGQGKGKGGG